MLKRDRTRCLLFEMLAPMLLVVLSFVAVAQGQVEIGDNLKMHLDGNLGYAYSGQFGTEMQSTHGQGLSANGQLSGYYYHPNFLSFDVKPYYDRSQANSDSQTIERGTGVNSTANFFTGSAFPGTVSYSQQLDSNSIYTIAGISSVETNSNGRQFTVSWNELLKGLPPVTATYSSSSQSASLLGLSDESHGSSNMFSLSSHYTLSGYGLTGYYNHVSSSFDSPGLLLPVSIKSSGSSSSYGASVSHSLPLSGDFGVSVSRYSGSSSDGLDSSGNTYTGTASLRPFSRLSLHSAISYYTNANSYILQTLLGESGATGVRANHDTSAVSMISGATFNIYKGLMATGTISHRITQFAGKELSDTQYGGTIAYRNQSRAFGFLYFGIGIIDTASKVGNHGTGLVGNVGMAKKFGHWDTSADLNYTQYLQTLGSFSTTSSLSFGGSIHRRFVNDLFWSASFRGSQSALTSRDGNGNSAQSYSSGLSHRRISLTGTYSQSQGTAVINSSGALVATDLAPVLTSDFMYFNARSYSIGGNKAWRHLNLIGNYTNVFSSTTQDPLHVTNSGVRYLGTLQYMVRRLAIGANYSRSVQDYSAVPGGPRVVNSYFLSISRWFNVF